MLLWRPWARIKCRIFRSRSQWWRACCRSELAFQECGLFPPRTPRGFLPTPSGAPALALSAPAPVPASMAAGDPTPLPCVACWSLLTLRFSEANNCKKHQLAEINGTRLYDYVYMRYSLVWMLDAVTISWTHVPRSVGLLRFQTLWKTQPPLLQTIQVLVSVYYVKICETDVPFLLGIKKHASKCPAYTVFAVALLCPMWCGSDWVPSNAAMDQTINDRSMCGSLEAKNCWSSPKLSPFKFVELSNCNSGLRIRYCWSKTLWVLDIPMLPTGKFRSWAKYILLYKYITVHTVHIIFIPIISDMGMDDQNSDTVKLPS